MATILIRLVGAMQSWGTTSRFDHRDTGKEPSKSGVIGLIASAMGIERDNWAELKPLAELNMGIRHDRAGIPKRDYQTVKDIISADHAKIHPTAVTPRDYLADAAFLVGLESADNALLEQVQSALKNPVWPMGLGRKSYVPSETIYLADGFQEKNLRDALISYPWIGKGTPPAKLLYSFETKDRSGVLRMDQLLSSFIDRRFGARFARSEWIPYSLEVNHVSA